MDRDRIDRAAGGQEVPQRPELWGPRIFGVRGRPRLGPVRAVPADTTLAARSWTASVELTGVEPFAS
jgi:hypothetical protein